MAEPVEASSLYSGAPLLSFGFGVQFNVGDFLRPVYAEDFPEMSPLESVGLYFPVFWRGSTVRCCRGKHLQHTL